MSDARSFKLEARSSESDVQSFESRGTGQKQSSEGGSRRSSRKVINMDKLLKSTLNTLPDVPLPSSAHPDLKNAPPGKEEAWMRCSQLIETHDEAMCKTYREEIDTFLVFGGLFSSAATAFSVEAYKWLQDDPSQRTADLLVQLIAITAAQNGDAAPLSPSQGPSISGAVAVRINAYWFLSLIMALSSALVGILCKQWLRRYERDLARTRDAPEALSVRQMKFEGLVHWKVGAIVSSVPILLLCALVLFLVGIVELLFELHRSIAIPAAVAVGLVLSLLLITTVLPLCQYAARGFSSRPSHHQCPYKSPQSWLLFRFGAPVVNAAVDVVHAFISRAAAAPNLTAVSADSSTLAFPYRLVKPLTMHETWADVDVHWTRTHDALASSPGPNGAPTYLYKALAWLHQAVDNPNLHSWIWHCLWDRPGSRASMIYVIRASRSQHEDESGLVTGPLDAISKGLPHSMRRDASLLAYSEPLLWDSNTSGTILELLTRLTLGHPSGNPVWLHRWFADAFFFVKPPKSDGERGQLFRVAKRFMSIDMPRPLRDTPWQRAQPDLLPHLLHVIVRLLAASEGKCNGSMKLACALCGLMAEWLQSKRHPDLAFRKTRLLHAADTVCTVYELLHTKLGGTLGELVRQPELALITHLVRTTSEEFGVIPVDVVPAPSSRFIPDPAGFEDDATPFFEALCAEATGTQARRAWDASSMVGSSVTSEFIAASNVEPSEWDGMSKISWETEDSPQKDGVVTWS